MLRAVRSIIVRLEERRVLDARGYDLMVAFEFLKNEFALFDTNRMLNQKRIAVTTMIIRYF